MKKIELINLEKDLNEFKDNKLIAVVLVNHGCDKCKIMLDFLQKIEPDFTDWEFWEVEVDDVPLFAPPALPSIIAFHRGIRRFEGVGLPIHVEDTARALSQWQQQWEMLTTGILKV